MSAIDFHTHAFPDELAGRAMPKLEASANWRAVGDGTVKGLLESMDQADVDITIICTIATRPGQAKGILKWCRQIASDRIVPLPSVHPLDDDAPRWIERFAEAGCLGIKVHPFYQDCPADDPRMDDIYQAVKDTGLLVVSHCGNDISFPGKEPIASPRRFANVINRWEGLRLVCTHMGGWRAWDEVEQHLIGKPVFLDTSFSLGELGPERSADMIRRHGVDHVLFASDWPWASQSSEIANIKSLPLSDAQKKQVLWSNASRLLL